MDWRQGRNQDNNRHKLAIKYQCIVRNGRKLCSSGYKQAVKQDEIDVGTHLATFNSVAVDKELTAPNKFKTTPHRRIGLIRIPMT